MIKMRFIMIVFFICVALVTNATAAPVNQVDYSTLTGTQIITFDDVAGGAAPGTNYDAIFRSGNTSFAERFLGQTLSYSGNFDILSGVPSASLSLAVGAPGQNLNIFINNTSQVLTGLGNLGYPNYDAIGEGSFAVLFDKDQSQFGFQLVGGDSGTAWIDFFKRDGSLISEITVSSLSEAYYGFSRDGDIKDIAGISIYNTDPAGIGFDNLKHDVAGVPTVPIPATLMLFGSGLLGLAGFKKKIKK
jgi:hypothetical protein